MKFLLCVWYIIFIALYELFVLLLLSIIKTFLLEWSNVTGHDRVKRQLSVSSDSKLLDEDIREEARVILRPRKPPRPKSEVLLNQQGCEHRRTKRFSAFGVCIKL